MKPLEILSKPITTLNPKLFQAPKPVTATPITPKPIVAPAISALSVPIPQSIVSKVTPTETPKVASPSMSNTKFSPLSILANPLPEKTTAMLKGPIVTDKKVRSQDVKDLGNLPFELAIKPVLNAALSLNEVRTGKASPNINAPFPHYQAVTDGDVTRMKPVEEPAQGTRRFYEDQIKKGVPEDQAWKAAIVKTVGDMSVLVPIFRDAAKLTLLKTSPGSLINSEIVNETTANVTKNQMRDYLAGRATDFEMPQELRESIAHVFKTGSKEEKTQLLQGVVGTQTLNVEPSRLGKMLGVSQEEADGLLTQLYGGKTRQAPVGALPGYTRDEPVPAFGASTERRKPVGFGDSEAFKGFNDLSSNVLEKLKGRSSVSKQFVSDLTNSPDLKQAERELIRTALADEGDTINVEQFANKVKSELLPLKRADYVDSSKYESISLPENLRGPVANYNEHIYESPIKTSAGKVHYSDYGARSDERPLTPENYFAHSRIEDLPNDDPSFPTYSDGTTRRVIEIQSDLFQRGRLENELGNKSVMDTSEVNARAEELKKLEPYRNTWHERVIKEEVKKAAEDGKTLLQFPNGETAMKIEGLGGETNHWLIEDDKENYGARDLTSADLKVGSTIHQTSLDDYVSGSGDQAKWVITDILDDGKFKAVPKRYMDDLEAKLAGKLETFSEENLHRVDTPEGKQKFLDGVSETFDISGKVSDTTNPIYKFYEKEVGRYLKNKYNAELVTDAQGVKWWEVKVNPEEVGKPVTAFQKGKEVKPNITKEEAEKIVRSMFSEKEIKLVFDKNLIKKGYLGMFTSGGQDIIGSYSKPMIELLEKNGMVSDHTLYHEAFHAHFNTFLSNAERKVTIEKVQKSVLTKSYKLKGLDYEGKDNQAEEWLADDFSDYVRTGKSKAKFEGFWEKLLRKLRAFIRKINGFQKTYDDILAGRREGGEAIPAKRAYFVDRGKPEPGKMGKFAIEKRVEEIKLLRDKGVMSQQAYELEQAKLDRDLSEMALKDNPARSLSKYQSKSGEFKGGLPEATGKGTSKFSRMGDELAEMAGFKDSEEARAAYDKYKKSKEAFEKKKVAVSEKVKDFQDKKAILTALRKEIASETKSRIEKVRSIQDFFLLEDQEMSKIMGFKGMRNISLMTDAQYDGFLKKVEGLAAENFLLNQERMNVGATIFEKELVKVDNLRQALKLPEIENMSISQLKEFNDILDTFQKGDEFLGVRQIETVRHTNLAGIRTKREALEALSKETNAPVSELQQISVKWLDRFLYDTSLSRRSPFHRMLVEGTDTAMIGASLRYSHFKKELNHLLKEARGSRKRGVVDRLAPMDKNIFRYLEANSQEKLDLAPRMTSAELKAALFVQEKYAAVRDYLVQDNVLKRYRQDYVTHIRRGFLEAWRESGKVRGLVTALKETFDVYKQDEVYFNILNEKTKDILPLEKFFQFSMKRSGNLVPSKNIGQAVLRYMSTFEKKVALDSIVPKMEIYTHSLTPKGMTPKGLEIDDSLKRFVKAWINNKKGRVNDLGGLIPPGGKIDWSLRAGVALVRLLDLGLNIPVGLASNLGEQIGTFTNIGTKRYALGTARYTTWKGRAIARKYESFVGETLLEQLRDSSKGLGDKLGTAIYGLFSSSARRANIQHLLGSMTKKEFESMTITEARLAAIKNEIGKYRVVEGAKSIAGKTAIGNVIMMYKTWAVPYLQTTSYNFKKLATMAAKKQFAKQEFQELFRATLITSLVLFLGYGEYKRLKGKSSKELTFVERLTQKAVGDALSMMGSLGPKLWLSTPRLISFITDLGIATQDILVSVTTGERSKKDKQIIGLSKLKSTITPAAVRPYINRKTANKPRSMKGGSGKIVLKKKAGTAPSLSKQKKVSKIKLVPKKIK